MALFNKDWNTYKTNWQNANGIGGKIGSIFASSNAGTSASVISNDQVQILRNWNNAVKHGCTDQVTFNRIIANADENTKMYFAGLNKGKGSIEGLKNAQKVATQSTIGLTIAQTALNMAITMGITALVSIIAKGYDELANSVENCKERVDDLMSSYKSALDTANNNASRVEELADKYEDLSKGVNNLGENVSLTKEEYQEYNSLVNEIAEMFPTLVQGYTDEGNAILNIKGNVEELRDAYKEAQQEAYNLLIASGEDTDGNDIIKQWEDTHDTGFWASILDLGADDVGGGISVADALKQLRAIQQMSADEYREIERITGSGSRKEIAGLTDIEKEIGYGSYLYKALGLNSNSTDEEFREAQRQAKALIQTYNAEIESALSDVETLANAYLMTNEDYDKLDAQSKSAASMIVNSLNADIANGFSSKEDVATYVDKIVQTIMSDDKSKVALTDLFTMDTSGMSINEIETQVDSYINTIATALKEDPIELKARLGFDNSDTEPLLKKVQGLLSDEFDSKVGELTLDELDIASKLKIPEGTLLTWDELITKIKEVQSSTSNNETDNLSGKSFKQIWNSLGTDTDEESKKVAEEKENLLKLAEAGQLTEKAFKNSSIADTFTKAGYSIEEATKKLNSFIDNTKQLSAMKTGITAITSAYDEKKEAKDNRVGVDTLESLYGTLGIGDWKNKDDLKVWEKYKEVASDNKSTLKDLKEAQDDLATSFVNSNNFLAQLDETNKDYYISTLSEMGVQNAEQVVLKALNEYTKPQIQLKEELKNKNIDLANSTWDNIAATDTFKNATGNARKALINLYAQENILSKSDLGLQDKVNMLRDFIQKALGASVATKIASKAFHNLAKASRAGMSTGEYEQIYNESYIDEFNKTMKKIDVKVKPPNSSDNKSGKDKSNKDKSSSSKQTIDWIERALSRISSTLDLVKAKAENLFGTNSLKTLQKQEASLKSQYNILKKQYDYQNKAEKKYLAKANSIKISSNKKTNASLKKAVQEGRISGSLKQLIATYGEKTATKIQNYQDYWDKAQDQKKSKEETKKSMRENISDRYQLHIDDADARKSRNEAELENLTTAKAKEKVLKDTKTQIATSYNYQIKQAQLEKDDVKVAELRAQKAKELRETEIQILQNYADEYEASVTLLENQSSSTTNVSKKNSLLQQSLTPLKQQYDKLIAIAAKEGDITEKKRLQVEYQNKLNAKLKEQFDNVADGYEFTQTQYQQRTDSINNRISLSEAQGRYVGEAFYTNLMNNQKNSQASIVAERDALITARADKLKNGLSIDSSEYREMTKKIWELDRSIEQGETDIANSAKQIREAKYAIDEFKQSRIDERNNEAEFYKTILEYKDSFDDNGVITSEGLGILTSDVFEIQNNLSKVEEYKKSLADLDAQYKRGDIGYDEFITKNQSLTESMRDAQSQVYSLKDAIKSLIEDGLNAQLDALNELIDKYKKTLDTEKDLRDYNKTVTEQTKNIATIQKQLEALNGDTSEEGRAKIQKLQVSLEDAKQQLEDTEYDKRISDIENIFDDLAEDYQDFIDDQMDHVDELVDKIISAITVNSGISGEKILELSKLFGFELSDSLKNFIEHSNNTTDSDAGDEANKKIKEDVESSKLQSQDYDKQSNKESDSVSGAIHKNTSTTNKTPSPGTLQQKTAILSSGKIQQWHQPSYGDIGHKATLEKGATYYNYALAGGIKKGDKGQTTKSNHSVTIKNVDNNGNVQIKSKNKNLNGAWIPKKKLTYLQGFSQGGRVGDLQNIIRMNGDDGITINTLKKGEEVLTPYNADLFDKFVDFLPDLVDYNNNLIDMVRPVNVPLGNIKTGDLTLNIDNIELPNVTDPKEFSEGLITAMQQDKNLQRFWGDATAGSLKNNMSSIYKY